MRKLKIGTRGSALAVAQARLVQEAFMKQGAESELVIVRTRGDADLSSPLSEIGRGAFTDVFSKMIASGELDVAVHSAKDLPTDEAHDVFFCLPRADARDALLFAAEREVLRVGTGSPRRAAAVQKLFPRATILPVRGNVDTRIQKMLAGEYDVLVLACAGLDRLGVAHPAIGIERLDPTVCVPAACQGIIAVEGETGRLIHDAATGETARIERSCQRLLGGGCTGGVGCYFDGTTLYAQKEGVIRSAVYRDARDILTLTEAFV